jgi:hypothetical protein
LGKGKWGKQGRLGRLGRLGKLGKGKSKKQVEKWFRRACSTGTS